MKKWKRVTALFLCMALMLSFMPGGRGIALAKQPSVTIDGASIRTTGEQGLRFKVTVHNYSEALNYGIKLTLGDKEVMVSPDYGYNKIYSYDEENDTIEYTAVITNLSEKQFDAVFRAEGFVTYDAQGTEETIWTDSIKRSIRSVADAAGYEYDAQLEKWVPKSDVTTEDSQNSEDDATTEEANNTTESATEEEEGSTTESTTEEEGDSTTEATTEEEEDSTTESTTEEEEGSTTESTTEEEEGSTTESTTEEEEGSTTEVPAEIEKEIGDFRFAKIDEGCNVTENQSGQAMVSFTNDYDAVYLAFPEGKNASDYASATINLTCEEQFGFALTDSEGNNLKTSYPGYDITYSKTQDFTLSFDSLDKDVTTPIEKGTLLRLMTLKNASYGSPAKHTSIILNSITFHEKKKPSENSETLLSTYKDIFGYVGNAVDLAQMQNEETLSYFKSEYNSLTLGNEMKPDYILQKNYNKTMISKEEAVSEYGYKIPDGYKEEEVPLLNFETVDKILKIASDNGLKMRGHTLIWHSQTPNWFFRENYDSNGAYVSEEVMNQRIVYFITNYMEHIYNSEYKDVIYAWDVTNEYLHQGTDPNKSGWVGVYGSSIVNNGKLSTTPEYVKLAFKTASSILDEHKMRDEVHLFYNDYNTYEVTKECISLIDYLNEQDDLNPDGTKLCDGIGMQSHLDVMWPSVDSYLKALDKFIAKGYEIQITELDVTLNMLGNQNNEEERLEYWQQLMEGIVTRQKQSHVITSFTIWGMYDDISWRSQYTPLLFSHSYYEPKEAYQRVIEAAKKYYE